MVYLLLAERLLNQGCLRAARYSPVAADRLRSLRRMLRFTDCLLAVMKDRRETMAG